MPAEVGDRDATIVRTLVRRAWRRRLSVTVAEEFGFGLSIVLGALLALALLGTDLLAWYWLAGATLAGALFTAWRVKRRLLPRYRVAQLVDRRWKLSDSISTAWYLTSRPQGSGPRNPAIEYAGRLAMTIHVGQTFPLRGGRSWLAAAALSLLLACVFATRCLLLDTLSLRPPLLPGLKALVSRPSTKTSEAKSSRLPTAQRNSNRDAEDHAGRDGQGPNEPGSGKADAGASPSKDSRNARSAGQPGSQTNAPGNDAKRSGLLDGLKDALAGLVQQARALASPSNGNERKEGQGQEAPKSGSGDRNIAKRNALADGRQKRDGQTGNPGAKGSPEQPAAKAGGNPGEAESTGSRTGAGKQDGAKAAREAADLQAMGKLAELINKRSAELTGDVVAETKSGEQHLQTAYTNGAGRHADAGNSIERDEIPPAYEQYIKNYVEAVHRRAATYYRGSPAPTGRTN